MCVCVCVCVREREREGVFEAHNYDTLFCSLLARYAPHATGKTEALYRGLEKGYAAPSMCTNLANVTLLQSHYRETAARGRGY